VGRSTPPGGGPAHVAAFACILGNGDGSPSLAPPTAKTALVAPDELPFEGPAGGPFHRSHEFSTLLNTRGVDSVWSLDSTANWLRIQELSASTLRPQAAVDVAVSIDHEATRALPAGTLAAGSAVRLAGTSDPRLPSTCHSPGCDASVVARLEAARTQSKPVWSPESTAVAVNRFPCAGIGMTNE